MKLETENEIKSKPKARRGVKANHSPWLTKSQCRHAKSTLNVAALDRAITVPANYQRIGTKIASDMAWYPNPISHSVTKLAANNTSIYCVQNYTQINHEMIAVM